MRQTTTKKFPLHIFILMLIGRVIKRSISACHCLACQTYSTNISILCSARSLLGNEVQLSKFQNEIEKISNKMKRIYMNGIQ